MTDFSISPVSSATSSPARISVWDMPVRLFHWLLVATILIAFLSSEEESLLAPWHVPAGWVAAVLVTFRLVWGFVGGEHARFADFLKPSKIRHHIGGLFRGKPERSIGHNALGGIAIVALLGTIGGIVYTGAAMQGEDGLHETLANILLGLIALHVVAVVAMSLLTKDNLIRAFITGTKRRSVPWLRGCAPSGTLGFARRRDRDRGKYVWSDSDRPLSIHPGRSCRGR